MVKRKKYGVKLITGKVRQEEIGVFEKMPFGVILGAASILLFSLLQMVKVWYDIELVNIGLSIVYFIGMFSAMTIIVDFLLYRRGN